MDDLGEIQHLKAGESADYLQDGHIDAAFFTFAVGTPAIRELANAKSVVFVPVDGAVRKKLMEQHPFYREAVIPKGAYQDDQRGAVPARDVQTVSVMATFVARADVPAPVVENVLRGIFENLDAFRQAHPRLRRITKAEAEANLTLPLHAGAKAFYSGSDEPKMAAEQSASERKSRLSISTPTTKVNTIVEQKCRHARAISWRPW